MSPEMLAGQPPNFESDMYSVTAILWELIHGEIDMIRFKFLIFKLYLLAYFLVAFNKISF